MQKTNIKIKQENIYKEALEKLRAISERQKKIIKKYSKILQKEKIEKLRKELKG